MYVHVGYILVILEEISKLMPEVLVQSLKHAR